MERKLESLCANYHKSCYSTVVKGEKSQKGIPPHPRAGALSIQTLHIHCQENPEVPPPHNMGSSFVHIYMR